MKEILFTHILLSNEIKELQSDFLGKKIIRPFMFRVCTLKTLISHNITAGLKQPLFNLFINIFTTVVTKNGKRVEYMIYACNALNLQGKF